MKPEHCLSLQLVQLDKVGPALLLKTFPIIRDATENPIRREFSAIILQVNTV